MSDYKAVYDKLTAELERRTSADKRVQSVLKKIESGKAALSDTFALAADKGRLLGAVFRENLADLDPQTTEKVYDMLMRDMQRDITDKMAAVQRAADEKHGISLGAPLPTYPAERIAKIAASLHDPTVPPETLARRAQSATETVTMAFHDDYVRDNAEFRSDAGFPCFIDRIADGGCCKWCAALAGKYRYPEEVPKDVYRRHDNCTCTVTYISGRKAQDVWSKTSRELPAEERERMKQIGFKKPTISAEEREQMLIAGMKKPQRLDIAGESGIIEDEIRKGNIKLDINHEKQAKHIKGCPEYIDGRSYLTISEDKAQKIINEKSGTGSLVYDRKGLWKNKELIDCDEIIGVDINKSTREETSTDKGTIHYSKSGTHLVPRKEKKHD